MSSLTAVWQQAAAFTHLCRMWPSLRLKVRRSPTLPPPEGLQKQKMTPDKSHRAHHHRSWPAGKALPLSSLPQKHEVAAAPVAAGPSPPAPNSSWDGAECQQRGVVQLLLQGAARLCGLLRRRQQQPVHATGHQACRQQGGMTISRCKATLQQLSPSPRAL